MRELFLFFALAAGAFAQTTCVGCAGSGGSATPGGTSGAVQFNDAGAMGGSSGFSLFVVPLSSPSAPTITPTCSGTCLTDYGYAVVGRAVVGTSSIGAEAYPFYNAASLDSTHYNLITPPACQTGQVAWDVIRNGPSSSANHQTYIGTISCGASLMDTGLPQWAGINQPVNNSAGTYVDGAIRVTGPVNSGPEYLIRAAQNVLGDGSHYGAVDDASHEDIVDFDGNSFVEANWFFTIYNENVTSGALASPIGSCGFQGSYVNNGTKTLNAFQCRDITTGANSGLGFDFFTASPKSGLTTNVLHFAQLDTCGSTFLDGQSNEGSMKAVDDSTVNTWGATITGGGSNHVLAYCNGVHWTVMSK